MRNRLVVVREEKVGNLIVTEMKLANDGLRFNVTDPKAGGFLAKFKDREAAIEFAKARAKEENA